MQIHPFDLERLQSVWENRVKWNLTESGVQSLRLEDLGLDHDVNGELLRYPQTNGSLELRTELARLYPGAGSDNLLVCSGTVEAIFLAVWRLVERGSEVVLMVPNWLQILHVAEAFGARVKTFPLVEREGRWEPDLDDLESAVSDRTELVAICSPNNPTGAVLTPEEVDRIVEITRRAGAWLLSDEVYIGSELEGPELPSLWGAYEKVIVVNGLSKTYAAPGLRIGWLTGPEELVRTLWGYKDYTSIGVSVISDSIARTLLSPEVRPRVIERTRKILNEQLGMLAEWVGRNEDLVSFTPPEAGGMAFVKYEPAVGSSELCRRARDGGDALIVPGDHFGMDGYVRIGFGGDPAVLEGGLAAFGGILRAAVHGSAP